MAHRASTHGADAFGSLKRSRSRIHKSVSTLTDTSLIHFEIYHERNRLQEELQRLEKAKDPEDRCREILKFINERTKSDSLLNPNESNPFLVRNRVRRKSASTNHSSRRPHRKSNSNSLVNTPKRTRIPPTLADTVVRMFDKTTRKICAVKVGDKVLSINIQSSTNTASMPNTPVDGNINNNNNNNNNSNNNPGLNHSQSVNINNRHGNQQNNDGTPTANHNNNNNDNNNNNKSNNDEIRNETFTSMSTMVRAQSHSIAHVPPELSTININGQMQSQTPRDRRSNRNGGKKSKKKPSTATARRSVNFQMRKNTHNGLPAPNRGGGIRLPQPYQHQRPMSARYRYTPQSATSGLPGLPANSRNSHYNNYTKKTNKRVGFTLDSGADGSRQRTKSQFLVNTSTSNNNNNNNTNGSGNSSGNGNGNGNKRRSGKNGGSTKLVHNVSADRFDSSTNARQRSNTVQSTKAPMGSMLPPPRSTGGSKSKKQSKPDSPRTREMKKLLESNPQLFKLNSNTSVASATSDGSYSSDDQMISDALRKKRQSLQLGQSTTTMVNGVATERTPPKIDPNLPQTTRENVHHTNTHSKSFSFNILPRLSDAIGMLSPLTSSSTPDADSGIQNGGGFASKSVSDLAKLRQEMNLQAQGTKSANLKSLNESNEEVPTFELYSVSVASGTSSSHGSSVSSASQTPGISAVNSSATSSVRSSVSSIPSMQGLSRTRSHHLPTSVSTVGLYKRSSAGSSLNNNNTRSGKNSMEAVSVTRIYEKMVYKLVTIDFENNSKVQCTPEQLFWIIGKGWGCADPKARMLKVGMNMGNNNSELIEDEKTNSSYNIKNGRYSTNESAGARRVRFNVSAMEAHSPHMTRQTQRKGSVGGKKQKRSQSTVIRRGITSDNRKLLNQLHALRNGTPLLHLSGSRTKIRQIEIRDIPKGIIVFCFAVNKNATYFANDLLIKNYDR